MTVAVAAVVLSVVNTRWKEFFARAVLPAGLMFGAAVFPVCNLQRIGNVDFADRYSYFPSLFIWMALGAAVVMLYQNQPEFRRMIKVAVASSNAPRNTATATFIIRRNSG